MDHLRSWLYLAEMASIVVELSVFNKGIKIRVSGYNDNIDNFIENLSTKINEFNLLFYGFLLSFIYMVVGFMFYITKIPEKYC
jgi:hypothetical protein